jgi:S1-C subfamily serine protease
MSKNNFETKKLSDMTENQKSDKSDIKNIYDEKDLIADKKFMKPITKSRLFVFALAIGSIFGIIGGIIGVLMFFSGIFSPFKISMEDLLPKQQIKIEKSEQVNVLEDERIAKISEKTEKSSVSIFIQKKISDKLVDNIYMPSDKLGSGLIISNDGWIVSYGGAIVDAGKNYVIVTYDKQILPVEKIIFDDYSGVVFLKTAGKNLNTLPLVSTADLKSGEKMFVLEGIGDNIRLREARVSENNWQDNSSLKSLTKSTSQISSYIILDDSFEDAFLGSAVFDLSGEAYGILIEKNGRQVVISFDDFKRAMEIVFLGKQKIDRIALGVKYLDLSELVGGSIKIKNGNEAKPLNYGALITEVVYGSSAAKAKILANDIIIKVGDTNVNSVNTLARLIQNYKAGDSANLTILRQGSEEEKIVTVNF